MSCFNCYSSRKIDAELVDKILERGHRLRSAMVQTILNNDPFNRDVILDQERKSVKLDDLSKEINEKIKAYLQGDAMSREDEILTLEALRSMSAADLCKATVRTYRSEEPCDCLTCAEYKEKDLKCDLKRGENNEITQKIQNRYRNESETYLRFVDSLKVSVSNVVLNEAGDKKVMDSLVKDKAMGVGQTFFLEYQIPEVLAKNLQKNKSKTDSGLGFGNVVRLCSRRSHLQAISFKSVSIHDISNVNQIKLEDAVITFRLSFRNFKQKTPIFLGVAKFSFSSFGLTKNFTCNQELTIRLNENTPIAVGGLKVSMQLGCGRLYFGKEFIDAITDNKENSIALGSDDLSGAESDIADKMLDYYYQNYSEKHPSFQKVGALKTKPQPQVPELNLFSSKTEAYVQKIDPLTRKSESVTRRSEQTSLNPKSIFRNSESFSQNLEPVSQKRESVYRQSESVPRKPELVSRQPALSSRKSESASRKIESTLRKSNDSQPKTGANPVLFGFVYISEAQFSREVMNSYLTCQMFTLDDVCGSKLVAFDSNPIYNFSQRIPIVCDDEFLLKLRENFMVVEFCEKGQKDFLIGLTKLPLHQFYLAYRNPVIVKYLSEGRLPVIGTDGWETIYNPSDGEVVGQAQFLVALGTQKQIDNLEKERGLKNLTVAAKVPFVKTTDVGVQYNMEPKKDIESLLTQIVAQKEHSVQVDSNEVVPEVRSTSDLLDSLNKALSIEKEKKWFKAHVAINSALHLPSRRKCKSKRNKGRNGKHEDILPSTYVTFEDYKNELKITPIIPKSTAPKWEFQCDVLLPTEYLTDNQKFLVFKVWRKSTNTTMTPNLTVDHVIGFATVDLTVLVAGLPSVQGWYNINDLSRKANGQINIHVTPLENVQNYQSELEKPTVDLAPPAPLPEAPFEPGELLGRALKRKFSELDEITQRLRLRLSKVTDESDTSNDELADEFERDINTLCIEDDFDLVDFEKEARNFNLNHIKEIGLLKTDRNLTENKPKIDQLLEKLSLLSGETSSRYVSGCSEARIDTEAILSDLDCHSRPNLHSNVSFHNEMVQKFGLSDENSEFRSVPEGEGEEDSADTKSD